MPRTHSHSSRVRAAGAAGAVTAVLLVPAATAAPTDRGGTPLATVAGAARGDGHHSVWKDSRKLRHAVTVRKMSRHLKALQRIADHEGDRAAGRRGHEASARYVESQLRQAGYRPWRQYFDFDYTETVAATLSQTSPEARDISIHPFSGSPSTPEGGLSADLVAPTDTLGCDAAGWEGVDATGTIALVSRGTCTFNVKALAAAAAGADAVLIYHNAPGDFTGGDLGDGDLIPAAAITQADGQALAADLADGPVSVDLDLRILHETRKTFNVIAEKRARHGHHRGGHGNGHGDDEDVVMLGAHLDGVQDGPGLNDNGSGIAATLEVARQLTRFKRLDNTVRFAWWGAEEDGLLGSNHYVQDLVDRDPEELGRIATYLNFDMIGSPNHIIGVYDADASSYPPTAPVPPGSIETEQVFRDYFDRVGQSVVDYQFSGRSDYQAFINNGVASGGLSTGSNGLKTEAEQALFGGEAGVAYDPQYHSAGDDISNINLPALDIQSDAMAHATIALAHDTSIVEPPRPTAPTPVDPKDRATGTVIR